MRSILSAVLLVVFSQHAQAALFFSQDGNGNGLFEINTTTGAASLVGAGVSGVTSSTVGLAPSPSNTILYGSRFSDLLEIQVDGSASNNLGGAGQEALAYCSGNGVLYGAINGRFTSINQATGSNITALAVPGFDMEGIACDGATNTVYGIGDDTLLRAYNTATDTWTTIGDTTINWDSGGLAWNGAVLYAIGGGGTAGDNLYTINPATAVATLIGPLGTTAEGGLAWNGALVSPAPPQAVPVLPVWVLALLMLGFAGLMRYQLRA